MRKLILALLCSTMAIALLALVGDKPQVNADDAPTDPDEDAVTVTTGPSLTNYIDPGWLDIEGEADDDKLYDPDEAEGSVTGEGVLSYTNHGWLSVPERKAFMRGEGYSEEYIEFTFEQELQLTAAMTSSEYTHKQIEQLVEQYNVQSNEMLRRYPLRTPWDAAEATPIQGETIPLDPDEAEGSVTGEGVLSYTNHGWLSVPERKAFMRGEGYSEEYIESFFEQELKLTAAMRSNQYTQDELEQMVEQFDAWNNEMLRQHQPSAPWDYEGLLVESVSSIDNVSASCANYEVNYFGGAGGIGTYKSEIVRNDNHAYVATGSCGGSCSPYVTHPTPISYAYGKATFTGSAPYFNFHNAFCQ